MLYDDLLMEYSNSHLIIKEKDLPANKGRIMGNKIAIRKNLSTTEKCCILAEELGHYYTTVGNIMDQSNTENQKQEQKARLWAYNKLIGLHGIVKAYQNGCQNLYETADYLDVTELFLLDTLKTYQNKYGTCVEYNNYMITFIPTLNVEQMR